MTSGVAAGQGDSEMQEEAVVWVRRQFDDKSHQAAYRLGDISGWHETTVSGGRQQSANRNYWHAYVMCDAMVEGEVGHSCRHGPPPHKIKVCVVKTGNERVWPNVLLAAEGDRAIARLLETWHRMSRQSSSKVGDVVDCILKRKFSNGVIGEKRLSQLRRVAREDVEDLWRAVTEAAALSDIGRQCAKSRFDDEILALTPLA
jgi:hypothetical protein